MCHVAIAHRTLISHVSVEAWSQNPYKTVYWEQLCGTEIPLVLIYSVYWNTHTETEHLLLKAC